MAIGHLSTGGHALSIIQLQQPLVLVGNGLKILEKVWISSSSHAQQTNSYTSLAPCEDSRN